MIRKSIQVAALVTLALVVVFVVGTLVRAAYLRRLHDKLAPCEETGTCEEGPFTDGDPYLMGP